MKKNKSLRFPFWMLCRAFVLKVFWCYIINLPSGLQRGVHHAVNTDPTLKRSLKVSNHSLHIF